jgi:hypothetical protein
MAVPKQDIVRDQRDEYAFHDDLVYLRQVKRGLSRETVEEISRIKGEPQWMTDRRLKALDHFLGGVKSDTTELNVTLLTTLQCNFACDYCFQGDHGDYNKFAEKMTMETAMRRATNSWFLSVLCITVTTMPLAMKAGGGKSVRSTH